MSLLAKPENYAAANWGTGDSAGVDLFLVADDSPCGDIKHYCCSCYSILYYSIRSIRSSIGCDVLGNCRPGCWRWAWCVAGGERVYTGLWLYGCMAIFGYPGRFPDLVRVRPLGWLRLGLCAWLAW